MELMNPNWLTSTPHEGVRLKQRADGSTALEVDYRLRDGSIVVQLVEGWRPGPRPENARARLARFGLELLWVGPRPDAELDDSPTYYVLGGIPHPPGRDAGCLAASSAERGRRMAAIRGYERQEPVDSLS